MNKIAKILLGYTASSRCLRIIQKANFMNDIQSIHSSSKLPRVRLVDKIFSDGVNWQKLIDLSRYVGPFLAFNGLKVAWYQTWNAQLDEVLHALPEMKDCPHQLYRLLLQNPGPDQKPIALLTEKKDPVALIGVRKEIVHWAPITQWLYPGELFPVKSGNFLRAVEVLGIDLSMGWWRQEMPPPQGKTLRLIETIPTHQLNCADDPEVFWRQNGHMKTIRKVRNRCKDFSFHVNQSGAVDWTLRGWHQHWFNRPLASTGEGLDRLLVAQYLENHGKHFTFTLTDGDVMIAGATVFVQGNDLVAGVCHRDEAYNHYGVGDSLLDRVFHWATESGYSTFDLGGGQDYKKHWAPQQGQRWLVRYIPSFLFYPKRFIQKVLSFRPQSRGSHTGL